MSERLNILLNNQNAASTIPAIMKGFIWAEIVEQTTSDDSYASFANFAITVSETPIVGIRYIWAVETGTKHLIYDASTCDNGVLIDGGRVVVYLGTQTQLPDPLIEAAIGVGKVPAFRGAAYAVFNLLPLARYNNRIPLPTFECF